MYFGVSVPERDPLMLVLFSEIVMIEQLARTRLTRALPTWFAWSPWADVTRARARRGPTVRGASGDRVG